MNKPVHDAIGEGRVRGMFIDGQEVQSVSGETMDVMNPSTGRAFARIACGNAEDVNIAVAAGKRAFSHGCVRVDKPFELAEEIMGKDGKWTEEKLRGLIGKGERYVNLTNPLPVHLTYFTLAVDEKGEVKRFDDIYGLDRKVRAALNLSE